jgi:hypothetical protein
MRTLLGPDVLNELIETARAAPPGDLVEVGVYQGGSAVRLAEVAREQKRRLFLFDTFSGIPHALSGIDTHRVGDFSDTSMEAVQALIPDAVLMAGVFPDTLLPEVGPIAVAHIDCDQYESVRACCLHLAPRMVSRGVMIFDDYDVLPGARMAVDDAFGDRVKISREGKARVVF